jgi:uncharacterized membrane protein
VSARHIGLIVGLVAGIVVMTLGLWKVVVILLLGAVGYVVGGVLSGDIDVQRFIDAVRRR